MKNIKKHIVKSFAVLFSAITLLTTTNSLTSHAISPKDLFNTIQKGNVEEVNSLIKEIKEKRPEDLKKFVNSINENGDNPLSFAAKKNQTEIARILLENGADVNAGSPNHGTTPIMYAVMGKNDTLFKMLLEKGADITISDKLGHNLFMFATNYSNNTAINFILQKAKDIYKDKPVELKKFINSRDDNNGKSTSLMLAAASGSLSAVNAVLENGANIEAKNEHNQNALMFAVGKPKGEISVIIINILLENLKNKYPQNPKKIINYILDKDIHSRNAINYAERRNNPEAVTILLNVLKKLGLDYCPATDTYNYIIGIDPSEMNCPTFNFDHPPYQK